MSGLVTFSIDYKGQLLDFAVNTNGSGADLQRRYLRLLNAAIENFINGEGARDNSLARQSSSGEWMPIDWTVLQSLKEGETLHLVSAEDSAAQSKSKISKEKIDLQETRKRPVEENTPRKRQKVRGEMSDSRQESLKSESVDSDRVEIVEKPRSTAQSGPSTAAARSEKHSKNSMAKSGTFQTRIKEKEVANSKNANKNSRIRRSPSVEQVDTVNAMPELIWCQMYEVTDMKPSHTILELKEHVAWTERNQEIQLFPHVNSAADVWVAIDHAGGMLRDDEKLGTLAGKRLLIEFRAVPGKKNLCKIQVDIGGKQSIIQIKEVKDVGPKKHCIKPLVHCLYEQLMEADPRVDVFRHSLYISDTTSERSHWELMPVDEFLAKYPLKKQGVTIKLIERTEDW